MGRMFSPERDNLIKGMGSGRKGALELVVWGCIGAGVTACLKMLDLIQYAGDH